MPKKPSVIELIHARLADKKSKPGARRDPWKLAVAVEGGAMRWPVAAGMMSLLEQYGIMPDLIVGTSGGGVASTYYAAGHMRYGALNIRTLGAKGYERDGKSKRFIDVRRLLKRQPIMDLEGMVEIAFSKKLPLDWNALRKSKTRAYLTAVNIKGEMVLQPLHGVPLAAQKQALKNTGRVPGIAHSARDTGVLWDGMLLASLPVNEAFALGATHVLAIRCHPAYEGLSDRLPMMWWAIALLLRGQNKLLYRMLKESFRINSVRMGELQRPRPDVKVLALPQVDIGVNEGDEGNLFRQLVTAYHFAADQLGLSRTPLPDLWAEDAVLYLK